GRRGHVAAARPDEQQPPAGAERQHGDDDDQDHVFHQAHSLADWLAAAPGRVLERAVRQPTASAPPFGDGGVSPATAVTFAWTIRLSWSIWAIPVAQIVHVSHIFHGNATEGMRVTGDAYRG